VAWRGVAWRGVAWRGSMIGRVGNNLLGLGYDLGRTDQVPVRLPAMP
jgi:hypothetical protein